MEPVTVVISRRVKPGRIEDFEAWLEGIIAVTTGFSGHLGTTVLRPSAPHTEPYLIMIRFDMVDNLLRWEESQERADWLARVVALTIGDPSIQKITGLEYWFTLPGQGTPPPRFKMAAVTVLGLFPLVGYLAPLLTDLFAPLSTPGAALMSLVVMVAIMTYVIMPLLTRLFRIWLYP